MSDRGGYGQFCPVSMASEIVCTRWTPLILRELICGTTRFNDLRRGLPRISPTLLSQRLKELEAAGVLETVPLSGGVNEYRLTEMGRELEPVIMALGSWGHRWIESSISLRNLDPTLLMWDMRRNLNAAALPARRTVIQFLYPEPSPANQTWWIVADKGQVDLCKTDPGHEVDLVIDADLRSMTAVWMGLARLRDEIAAGRIKLDGDRALARTVETWLGLSGFAPLERRVA